MKRKPTGDLQFVQQMNRKLILDTLLNHAPLSRVEIARLTTLSPSTVANAISELIDEGLVYEIGTVPSSVGRRPTLLDICWGARSVIGLSFLDNHVIGVRTNLKAEKQETYAREFADDADIVLIAKDAVDYLLKNQNRENVLGIGISTPGILDRELGDIELSTNFPWKKLSLGRVIQEHTGIATILENDTNLSALGERHFGKGRGVNSFAYIHVGTGVGAGLVVDGHILLGNRGIAGEIGHMTVDWRGNACRCGGFGCLESYVNWQAVCASLAKYVQDPELLHGLHSISDRASVIKRMYADELPRQTLDQTAHILGAGIASLVTVTDPQMVIVEGMYRLCDGFMKELRNEVVLRLQNLTGGVPEITLGDLGEEAPVLGAVALVLERNAFLGAMTIPHPEAGLAVESGL